MKVKYPKDKVLGGIWGLIIGDTVGVPYEFNPPSKLPPKEEIDIIAPKGFRKTYSDIPYGTYSDDSAMFLCILDSYIACDGFDIDDIAKKFLNWATDGYWAVDNDVFDIGIQTRLALAEYSRGMSPWDSGFLNPDGKGNGSLMRTLAVALLEDGDDKQLVESSHGQSVITHGPITNQVCCALYNLIARYLLEGMEFEVAYEKAVEVLKEIYKSEYKAHYEELVERILPDGVVEERGTGYVLDSIKTTFTILRKCSSYEDVIKTAISYGHDTDTTAAIVGGLAGIIYGFESIPKRWYELTRAKEDIIALIDKIEFA